MIKNLYYTFCISVLIFLISALLYAGFSIGIVEGILGVLEITTFFVYIYKGITNNESDIS